MSSRKTCAMNWLGVEGSDQPDYAGWYSNARRA